MVPTKEEEAILANYKGDPTELGSAERLVKAMLQIPHAFSRIDAMLYRETFEDEVLHLKKSFSILEVRSRIAFWHDISYCIVRCLADIKNISKVNIFSHCSRKCDIKMQ